MVRSALSSLGILHLRRRAEPEGRNARGWRYRRMVTVLSGWSRSRTCREHVAPYLVSVPPPQPIHRLRGPDRLSTDDQNDNTMARVREDIDELAAEPQNLLPTRGGSMHNATHDGGDS
jgi:hypothetical protein